MGHPEGHTGTWGAPKGNTQRGEQPQKDLRHRGMGFSKARGTAVTERKGASPRESVSANYFPFLVSMGQGKNTALSHILGQDPQNSYCLGPARMEQQYAALL